jgi:hypothetical protein
VMCRSIRLSPKSHAPAIARSGGAAVHQVMSDGVADKHTVTM